MNARKLLELHKTSIEYVSYGGCCLWSSALLVVRKWRAAQNRSIWGKTLSKVAFRNHPKFLCTTHFIKSLICFPFFVSTRSWYFHVLSLFSVFIYTHLHYFILFFIQWNLSPFPIAFLLLLLLVCFFAFVFSSIGISSTVTFIFLSRILISFP